MQIAANIKALREQKGMSQEELAKMCGLSRGAIAKIETNWKFPSFESGLRIAKALGVTCEELAYGKAEQAES
ncbi:MAG: helix-turn-helix transcriptional regulator [Oscillospiraceae bacterium]|nr:helix-turn-helix transcriptional regulator [Oscillospiraceae bacterium]